MTITDLTKATLENKFFKDKIKLYEEDYVFIDKNMKEGKDINGSPVINCYGINCTDCPLHSIIEEDDGSIFNLCNIVTTTFESIASSKEAEEILPYTEHIDETKRKKIVSVVNEVIIDNPSLRF